MSDGTERVRIEWSSWRTVDGLRTRYRPGCRINHAFFTVAPWIDVLLLVASFSLMVGARSIVPGIRVELPVAPFREGLSSDLLLVVNPVHTGNPVGPGRPGEQGAAADAKAPAILVFFNDDRFNLTDVSHRNGLRQALSAHIERFGRRDALLYIDQRVAHGDVVRLISILRETGLRQVNLAVKAL